MNKKNLFSYVFCFFLSLFITFYINGRGGVMLCVCLVAAFVISLADFHLVKNKIMFNVDFDNRNLRKNDIFTVTLTVSKKTVFPTPYVEIKLKSTGKLVPVKTESFKTSLFSKNEKTTIKAEYKAVFSGRAKVEIEYVRLTDFMGLFTKKIYAETENDAASLRVLPEIPDDVFASELLKTTADVAASDDNDEDTGETVRFGSGFPGYEHRVYVPGDPIKKVNWKLSSKRDVYLLRLDEKISVTGRVMVLDIISDNPSHNQLSENDLLIEGCLGMISSMLKQELTCTCIYHAENGWQSVELCDEKSLLELQLALSDYDETKPHVSRFPKNLEKEKGTTVAVVFSNNLDDAVASEGNTPLMQSFFVTTSESIAVHPDNVWIIDENYQLKLV